MTPDRVLSDAASLEADVAGCPVDVVDLVTEIASAVRAFVPRADAVGAEALDVASAALRRTGEILHRYRRLPAEWALTAPLGTDPRTPHERMLGAATAPRTAHVRLVAALAHVARYVEHLDEAARHADTLALIELAAEIEAHLVPYGTAASASTEAADAVQAPEPSRDAGGLVVITLIFLVLALGLLLSRALPGDDHSGMPVAQLVIGARP